MLDCNAIQEHRCEKSHGFSWKFIDNTTFLYFGLTLLGATFDSREHDRASERELTSVSRYVAILHAGKHHTS